MLVGLFRGVERRSTCISGKTVLHVSLFFIIIGVGWFFRRRDKPFLCLWVCLGNVCGHLWEWY